MKKLFLAVVIFAIIGAGLIGCKKQAGTEHPSKGTQPKAEHPK